MNNKYAYLIIFVIIAYMIIHVELIVNRQYAPESVLINVATKEGLPETNAKCYADISSSQVNQENKELQELSTIYQVVDPTIFTGIIDKGYYLLETGFQQYTGKFEIRIVCYSPGFKGVSYTILNNTNIPCEMKEGGKLVIC